MSYPHDRPTNEPGGMECYECGVIFVGGAAHDQCAICANNGWRPLDTAPNDGTAILVSTTIYGVIVASYLMGEQQWVSVPATQYIPEKSDRWLWQPLPKPPVQQHP